MEMSGWERAFESEVVFFAGRKLIEFDDFETEKVSEVVGIAGVRREVIFVDEAGIEGSHQRTAVLNIKLEAIGLTARKEMKGRGDHEFVAGKIFGRASKIHRDIAIVKGGIEKKDVVAQIKIFV